MLDKAIAAAFVLFATIVAIGAVAPDETRVERMIRVAAPKARVLPLLGGVIGCDVANRGVMCATLRDGMRRHLANEERFGAGTVVAGFAIVEVRETPDGVLAVCSYTTRLRGSAAPWARPLAAYRGLLLHRQVAEAFDEGLMRLKHEAERA